MPPKAHITHKMKGRTRLRIPARRGDAAYFRQVETKLESVPGIQEVSANPTTGSVLIHHEENTAALVQHVMELRLFQIVPPEVEALNPNLTIELAKKLEETDRRVRKATGGRVDLNGAMIVASLAAGIYQILRGEILPAGGSLVWYALGLAWLRPSKSSESTA